MKRRGSFSHRMDVPDDTTDKETNERTNERTDRRTDGRTKRRVCSSVRPFVSNSIYETDRCTDGQSIRPSLIWSLTHND